MKKHSFHLVRSAIGEKETDDILCRAEQERQRAEKVKALCFRIFGIWYSPQKLTDDLMWQNCKDAPGIV